MAKLRTVFICRECGYKTPKWMGRCPSCNEWNTFEEDVEETGTPSKNAAASPAVSVGAGRSPETLRDINTLPEHRESTGSGELDRVLGGGLVPGSIVLLGGDPGIGKSTILLQMAGRLAEKGKKVLYISGEESARQIKLRADRLGVTSGGLLVLSETRMDAIERAVEKVSPDCLVADSIQTMYSDLISSAPGSVTQVRQCAAQFMGMGKKRDMVTFLVGHVTKEGALAGPRVLEHMVDTVLYFEGERHHSYRILRSVKNRFGPTHETGLFEMKESGLEEVDNPSGRLLLQREKDVAGAAVFCSLEGTRPVLVEIQALVCPTAFGTPRRMSTGMELNRANLLMAVLEKKGAVPLYNQDVYINVAGGMKLFEPAADLPMLAAVVSAYTEKALSQRMALFGEVGLTGEIRSVARAGQRVFECARLGFEECILPKDDLPAAGKETGVRLHGVSTISEAINLLLK